MKEQIGIGRHKDVYVDSRKPDRIIAEFRGVKLDNEQIKSAYYLNKILHLLFPDNVPNVSAAGNAEKSYIESQRIEHDPDHENFQQIMLRQKIVSGFSGRDVRDALTKRAKDLDVKTFVTKTREAGFIIDTGGINYSKMPGKPVKYLDLNPAWRYLDGSGKKTIFLNFNYEKLLDAINNLPLREKSIATPYFERLLDLVRQKQEELDSI